ncbi:MAG: SDR family NAD(P)-dependent oxidoreductase, partial [Acidimicrobiia bacterium]|nr:SDR family NAD(P)-dependent oxidoreductase [Acidimicrobiia bacterium]
LAGAEVFCTASPAKWHVLQSLGVEHVFDSRTVAFADAIRELTRGEGVDVVLSSLTGDAVTRGLALLRRGGRFLEIGKRDVRDAKAVAAAHPDVAYHAFDLAELCRAEPEAVGRLLERLLVRFEAGELTPLPSRAFDLARAREAFRLMQQARHTGKILIRMPRESSSRTVAFRPDATYLITGGLGALGLLTARWITDRGVRHVVLTGRGEPGTGARDRIAALEAAGAAVRVVRADVADADQVRSVLEEIRRSMPPLRGVVHAAGLLDDGVLTQQTPERFERVLAPKVAGAWNLHVLTRDDPLDFFVMYGSAAALLGSAGQANHAAANAFLDGLAHHRRASGLPALAIDWGAWSGIGAAEQRQAGERLRAKGLGTIAPTQGLQVLERLLAGDATQVSVLPVSWPQFLQQQGDTPFFADFAEDGGRQAGVATLNQLLEQTPVHERPAAVRAFVIAQVARVLGLGSTDDLDPDLGFFDLGMDSLTAVELRSRFQAELGRPLPSTVVFDYPNIAALARFLAGEVLGLAGQAGDGEPAGGPHDDGDALDDLSDAELADLLSKKLNSLNSFCRVRETHRSE